MFTTNKLVKKFGSYKHRQEWSRLNNYVDLSDFSEQLFYEPPADDEKEILALPKEFISLANKNLPISSAYALQYLRGRNITKKDIVKWKILTPVLASVDFSTNTLRMNLFNLQQIGLH